MQNAVQWLTRLNADGVSLNLEQLLYYKGKTSLLDLSPRRTIQAKLAGSYLAKTKGRGMEFDEARHYQPGDDIRAIDWRVTARTGKTHTKVYREEKERPVFVLTDLSSSMHFGTQLMFKSVQAAHLTALIGWASVSRGDRIGGLLFNDSQHLEIKPLTRQKAVLSLLHGLLELHTPAQNNSASVDFAETCARLRRLARPGSLVFVISDFSQFNDDAQQQLSHLSRHCEIIAHPISDPFEHELPSVSGQQQVAITDGTEEQTLVLGERETALTYQREHQAFYQRVFDKLRQCHAQVIPVSAAMALEQQLTTERRGRR